LLALFIDRQCSNGVKAPAGPNKQAPNGQSRFNPIDSLLCLCPSVSARLYLSLSVPDQFLCFIKVPARYDFFINTALAQSQLLSLLPTLPEDLGKLLHSWKFDSSVGGSPNSSSNSSEMKWGVGTYCFARTFRCLRLLCYVSTLLPTHLFNLPHL